jgi:ion channel-forming bestrophin family protein
MILPDKTSHPTHPTLQTTATAGWFQTIAQVEGSIFPNILPRVLLFVGISLVVWLVSRLDLPFEMQGLAKLTDNVACNLVLGLLLVFRTNTAYERFWEGRKAWGTLVINIRNLAREIAVGLAGDRPELQAEKVKLLNLLVVFAIATKHHLRRPKDSSQLNDADLSDPELANWLEAERRSVLQQADNAPLQTALWIGQGLQHQFNQQAIDASQRWAMNNLLNDLIAGLTSCERIRSTPMPVAYATYLKALLLVYCLFLPFGLVDVLGAWTALVMALVSFILFGVEAIGDEIEDPFGTDPNDLPIDQICETMRREVEGLRK